MSQVQTRKATSELVREIAWKAVREKLSDSYAYNTTFHEKELHWIVTFVPDAKVRGGGAQVTVDKDHLMVTDVTFLQ